MSLYKVTFMFDMVVESNNPDDAAWTACDYANQELENVTRNKGPVAKDMTKIKSDGDLPSGWHNSIPWGHDAGSDKTCKEILASDQGHST